MATSRRSDFGNAPTVAYCVQLLFQSHVHSCGSWKTNRRHSRVLKKTFGAESAFQAAFHKQRSRPCLSKQPGLITCPGFTMKMSFTFECYNMKVIEFKAN